MKWDAGRWRVLLHSETVSDFLIAALGLTHGPSAREKTHPRSHPAFAGARGARFVRAYFDCDAYAGRQGVILSSASKLLIRADAAPTPELRRAEPGAGEPGRRRATCMSPAPPPSASTSRSGSASFARQRALEAYLAEAHKWFLKENWTTRSSRSSRVVARRLRHLGRRRRIATSRRGSSITTLTGTPSSDDRARRRRLARSSTTRRTTPA